MTMNEKINKEWAEFAKQMTEAGKQLTEAGKQTANETAGAAADVLKALSKELGTLSEKLEKWVVSTKKAEADAAAQNKDAEPPKPEQKTL